MGKCHKHFVTWVVVDDCESLSFAVSPPVLLEAVHVYVIAIVPCVTKLAISVTHALLHRKFIVDPTLREELVMEGRLTFIVNTHREICAIQKAGGNAMSQESILKCGSIALVKAQELTIAIKNAITANTIKAS